MVSVTTGRVAPLQLAATSTKFGPVAAVGVAIVIVPEPVVTTPDITIGTPATFAVAVMTDPATE
jgi:hypothetical protein